MFADWRELRVDSDRKAAPDLLADITDLSAIESGSIDAVWSAHCLEHLYLHQVPARSPRCTGSWPMTGFMCLIVPDLQVLAEFIVNDKLHEVVYQSAAGPVTAHDIDLRLRTVSGAGPITAWRTDAVSPRACWCASCRNRRLPRSSCGGGRTRNSRPLPRKRPPASDAEREALLEALEL